MKVKVVKRFIDKETNELHKPDSEFECTKERYEEIKVCGNFVVPVENENKKRNIGEKENNGT